MYDYSHSYKMMDKLLLNAMTPLYYRLFIMPIIIMLSLSCKQICILAGHRERALAPLYLHYHPHGQSALRKGISQEEIQNKKSPRRDCRHRASIMGR